MSATATTRLLVAGALLAGAAAAQATEPFYLELLASGTRDYLRSDYPSAARKLRIACFGLLDDPPVLTEGLIRLALAQAGAGDDEGFRAAFYRLVDVEAAFGSYGELPPTTPFKGEFERVLPQRVAAADLARAPAAFAGLLAGLREAELTALPPKRLRTDLERRLKADPEDSEALVLLTRLDISQDRSARARKRLADLLAANPENRIARCVRGQMRLRDDDCRGAMEDLPNCSASPTDEVLGARYLRCLIAATDWPAASEHLAALPLEVRGLEEVANLVLAMPPEALDEISRPPASEGDRGPTVTEDQVRTESLRRRLHDASQLAELAALLVDAGELADRHPNDRALQFLAAEIAYRGANWAETVRFFRRGGLPGLDQPLLRFYLAVALFESGEASEAADTLEPVLPMLEPTAFVERYRALILGPSKPVPGS